MKKMGLLRHLLGATAMTLALGASTAALAADPNKVLRLASFDIETLDPQRINDDPSSQVAAAIFEGLYDWSYLGTPPHLVAVSASALPEIADGGRTWTLRLQPGIRFTDDPAFGGQPRELVAEDIVYSMKRALDPTLKRGGNAAVTDVIVGARAVVETAEKAGRFDYDRTIEGLRAIDRHTIQIRLSHPNYPVIESFLTTAAVAREVITAANGDARTRPVGTGPYRLREWLQGSRIVLDANPYYRTIAFPTSNDPRDADLVRSMQGVALPQIGVVEVNVIDEELTRVLQFDRGRLDYVVLTGVAGARAVNGGKLRKEYTDRGVTRRAYPEPYVAALFFNMSDATIGGMDLAHIALRRAMALAIDRDAWVDVVYAGQGSAANQVVPPTVAGHIANLPKADHDPRLANALLDRFGYRKDGEGYRMTPDGKPLSIRVTLRIAPATRDQQTLLKKNMDAIGIRLNFKVTLFQELLKESAAGAYQINAFAMGGLPTAYGVTVQFYSRSPVTVNPTRFSMPRFDQAFESYIGGGDDAAQAASVAAMNALLQYYVPMVPLVFRTESELVQPWLKGFAPPVFNSYFKYLDIDLDAQRAASR
ncbi:MAG: ABC transporter substrate-binding protein [Casimicrobiaceae bacterium]